LSKKENKLSESDIDWLRFNCTPDLVDMILGFERDAGKYRIIGKTVSIKILDQHTKAIEIVELLKKLIERKPQYNCLGQDMIPISDIQKILGEEEFIKKFKIGYEDEE